MSVSSVYDTAVREAVQRIRQAADDALVAPDCPVMYQPDLANIRQLAQRLDRLLIIYAGGGAPDASPSAESAAVAASLNGLTTRQQRAETARLRRAELLAMRRAGLTVDAIAQRVGVSQPRVSQLLARARADDQQAQPVSNAEE